MDNDCIAVRRDVIQILNIKMRNVVLRTLHDVITLQGGNEAMGRCSLDSSGGGSSAGGEWTEWLRSGWMWRGLSSDLRRWSWMGWRRHCDSSHWFDTESSREEDTFEVCAMRWSPWSVLCTPVETVAEWRQNVSLWKLFAGLIQFMAI